MDSELQAAVGRLLEPFLQETREDGSIDASASLWQRPGRGAAIGTGMFPGDTDLRHLRLLGEALYRFADLTGDDRYRSVATAHTRFMARAMRQSTPTWALGNALEMIGLTHAHGQGDGALVEMAERILVWARERKVTVTTVDGVTFEHFPCGYGLLAASDAGWTNDLSMFGAGLVWAHELLGDETILQEAISFAEYFVQPWRADALGPDGFWACGSWREDLGSWVIGPAHFSGFESTDLYSDEASWVFSTLTCADYLMRLTARHPDPRYLDRCVTATRWVISSCQFEDGAVGMCGRDDRWLGFSGDLITQVALLRPFLSPTDPRLQTLLDAACLSWRYLAARLPQARLEDHGVEWVNRTTSTDPLVNVAMLWASALLGALNAQSLFQTA